MNRHYGLPDGAPLKTLERQSAGRLLPRGWIDGLALSNDGTDATNDIAVAAGSAKSTVNVIDGEASTLTKDQIDLELPVTIIKQLDVSFAPENYSDDATSGGRSGGRSASSISNTTWHVFLIGGGTTKPDVFFHDSATQSSIVAAMTKLGDYTAYRMIGSIVRASAAILPFTQTGDRFDLTTPVLDVDNATPGTSANTGTFASVPTGLVLEVLYDFFLAAAGGVYVSPLFTTDLGVSVSISPLATSYNSSGTHAHAGGVIVNSSAQFRYRSSVNNHLYFVTRGWIHPRGKNA